jgi:hypothetical protein
MLLGIVKDIFSHRRLKIDFEASSPPSSVKRVLNVGGGNKLIRISQHYDGWQHDLLDIDPAGQPDLVCDARELTKLNGGTYDAIYCSHNLEHYYRHDGLNVVRGFHHMLNETGFAEIRVPDLVQVISALVERQLDLDDELYRSSAGPISAHDVIYGLQIQIKNSGQDFYAHKTGFTSHSLIRMLKEGGFEKVFLIDDEPMAVHAFAFKTEPTQEQRELLGQALKLDAS